MLSSASRLCRHIARGSRQQQHRAAGVRLFGDAPPPPSTWIPRARRALCSTSSDVATSGTGEASEEPAQQLDVIWQLRHIVDELPPVVRQAYSRDNMSQPEINKLEIQDVIREWQRDGLDTGSSEVQVAIMTKRLEHMTAHMKAHHKDKHSKRRLFMLVGQRNRLLKYLRRTDRARYNLTLERLGIRPNKSFDPTIVKHARPSTTNWRAKGPHYVPKKRRPRASPYGEAKSPKGRTRLQAHAARQRRLQRQRDLLEAAARKEAQIQAQTGAAQQAR